MKKLGHKLIDVNIGVKQAQNSLSIYRIFEFYAYDFYKHDNFFR